MNLLKRGQRGFTLVELMVVMAIMAVLASIVFPAVSGTSQVAGDSQVRQDAGTINTAVGDYFSDQAGASVFSANTTSILGTGNITQKINSRFPEKYLTVGYLKEFPVNAASTTTTTTDNGTTTTTITPTADVTAEVNIKDLDGTAITAKALAESRNALDLAKLDEKDYIAAIPKSAEDMAGSGSVLFYNYLWLVKITKATADGGTTVESRQVEVYKLTQAVKDETKKNYTLYYEQIY